jgi:hypothetical protein
MLQPEGKTSRTGSAEITAAMFERYKKIRIMKHGYVRRSRDRRPKTIVYPTALGYRYH